MGVREVTALCGSAVSNLSSFDEEKSDSETVGAVDSGGEVSDAGFDVICGEAREGHDASAWNPTGKAMSTALEIA
ncbi:MAG: hypothetical protein Q4P33_09145 [Flaviflexus sp.]|nr:hypothetical protein [Flaviflexus sp.]